MKSITFPFIPKALGVLLLMTYPTLPLWPVLAQTQNDVPAQMASSAPPLRMVVLPFKNITRLPEDAWMSESFSESLTMSLAQVDSLQVIERSQIQAVLQEQSFTQSAFVDPQTAP
ncbi:MAG: CsgG/HfaB family protein [Candidatus Sericytochromatia bacterium]